MLIKPAACVERVDAEYLGAAAVGEGDGGLSSASLSFASIGTFSDSRCLIVLSRALLRLGIFTNLSKQ